MNSFVAYNERISLTLSHFRTYFLLSFVFVFVLSIYFISNIYEKWSATPVIITVDSVSTSIRDVPFPAVTICNMNQARKTVINQLNVSEDPLRQSYLNNICELDTDPRTQDAISNIKYNGTNNWKTFRQFLVNVSQPCSEMLLECRFASKPFPCMNLFASILTDEGICCVFNAVHGRFLYHNYRYLNVIRVSNYIGPIITALPYMSMALT